MAHSFLEISQTMRGSQLNDTGKAVEPFAGHLLRNNGSLCTILPTVGVFWSGSNPFAAPELDSQFPQLVRRYDTLTTAVSRKIGSAQLPVSQPRLNHNLNNL